MTLPKRQMDAITFDHDRNDARAPLQLGNTLNMFHNTYGILVLTEKRKVEHEDTRETTADVKTHYV